MTATRLMRSLFLLPLTLVGCGAEPTGPTMNRCGDGTTLVVDQCLLTASLIGQQVQGKRCGEGTGLIAGLCELTVQAAGMECGVGTSLVDGTCVLQETEPAADAGQIQADPAPVPPRRTCGAGAVERDGFCFRDDSGLRTCGPGTVERDGVCESFGLDCGEGTHVEGGACVPDQAALFCGPGTQAEDGFCLPLEAITCGPGTEDVDGECLPSIASMQCGAGTEERDNQCVVNGDIVTCGEGTTEHEGACVLDETWAPCARGTVEVEGDCVRDEEAPLAHSYELRIPVDVIPADGLSHVPLIAYGRNDQGEPSTAAVVVWADRPEAGEVRPGVTTLEQAGRRFWFVPCHFRTEGCSGAVRFHMALASDPDHIVASTPEVQVTSAEDVSTMAPCLEGGSVFFTTGHPDHPVVRRTKFLQRAAYNVRPMVAEGGELSFEVYPDDQDDGQRWEVSVGDSAVGVYRDSNMSFQLNGPVCDGGQFQIHSIDVDWRGDGRGYVVGLEASWRVECLDPGRTPYPTLVGCIRIDPLDSGGI